MIVPPSPDTSNFKNDSRSGDVSAARVRDAPPFTDGGAASTRASAIGARFTVETRGDCAMPLISSAEGSASDPEHPTNTNAAHAPRRSIHAPSGPRLQGQLPVRFSG